MQIMVSRIFPQIAKGFNDTFSLPLFDVMSLKVKRRPDSSNGLNVAQKLQLTTNHSNSIAWARFWFWYGFGSGFGFSFGFGSGHRLQFWDSGPEPEPGDCVSSRRWELNSPLTGNMGSRRNA